MTESERERERKLFHSENRTSDFACCEKTKDGYLRFCSGYKTGYMSGGLPSFYGKVADATATDILDATARNIMAYYHITGKTNNQTYLQFVENVNISACVPVGFKSWSGLFEFSLGPHDHRSHNLFSGVQSGLKFAYHCVDPTIDINEPYDDERFTRHDNFHGSVYYLFPEAVSCDEVTDALVENLVVVFYKLVRNNVREMLKITDMFEKFITKYPFLIRECDEHGMSIFNTIFGKGTTYEQTIKNYHFLTKQLNVRPFGRSLVCSVMNASRITEHDLKNHKGCDCCLRNSSNVNYFDIVDELISIPDAHYSVFGYDELKENSVTGLVLSECDVDYARAFFEKYGMVDLNKDSGIFLAARMWDCWGQHDDNKFLELLEYLVPLGLDLTVRDTEGKNLLFYTATMYPKTFKFLLDHGLKSTIHDCDVEGNTIRDHLEANKKSRKSIVTENLKQLEDILTQDGANHSAGYVDTV